MGKYQASSEVYIVSGKATPQNLNLKYTDSAVIYGNVVFPNGNVVKGASVVLSYKTGSNKMIVVDYTFTNVNGFFSFVVKDTNYEYIIQASYNS